MTDLTDSTNSFCVNSSFPLFLSKQHLVSHIEFSIHVICQENPLGFCHSSKYVLLFQSVRKKNTALNQYFHHHFT